MTNKPKAIGTTAETGVVRYLLANGFPQAERRPLKGGYDEGDITGCLGICWEVKGGDKARTAYDELIDTWLNQTSTERVNSGADVGVLVVARPGYGPKRAGNWWAIMPGWEFVGLGMDEFSHTRRPALLDFPVRMLLADAVRLLRTAGYGDPLEVTP